MSMKLIAHRCGTDKFPELTLDAARYSLTNGFSCVEMDIRFTKDDFPVICHDYNALRLFGLTDNICDMLLSDFKKLRYIGDYRYTSITLEDVLHSSVAPILFHVKDSGTRLKKILQYIRKYDYEEKVVMGLVNCEDIQIVKEFNPSIKVLGFIPTESDIEAFVDRGADIIRLWEKWVDKDRVDKIKRFGKEVWVMAGAGEKVGYTNKENLIKWRDMNIDGILINEINDCKFLLELNKV